MLISYVRTIIVYLVLIAVIRLMGKRQVGQMEPSEFVVTMLVANLAAVPMQGGEVPLYAGIVPILTVLGVELVLSWLSVESLWVRRLLCGKPVILVDNGVPVRENLRRTRVTLDELTGMLREKDVLNLSEVQFAILETSGNLSVFPYPNKGTRSLPVSLIEDGVFLYRNLPLSGKDERWLQRELKKRNATVKTTWYLSVDAQGNVIFFRKESKP